MLDLIELCSPTGRWAAPNSGCRSDWGIDRKTIANIWPRRSPMASSSAANHRASSSGAELIAGWFPS